MLLVAEKEGQKINCMDYHWTSAIKSTWLWNERKFIIKILSMYFDYLQYLTISAFFWQVYPGLMLTSASVHWTLNTLNITVHIRDVCVFLAPMFRSVHFFYLIKLIHLWLNDIPLITTTSAFLNLVECCFDWLNGLCYSFVIGQLCVVPAWCC